MNVLLNEWIVTSTFHSGQYSFSNLQNFVLLCNSTRKNGCKVFYVLVFNMLSSNCNDSAVFATKLYQFPWKIHISREKLQTSFFLFSYLLKWVVFVLFQSSFLKGTAEFYNIHKKLDSFCNVASRLFFFAILMKDDKGGFFL